MLKKKYVCGCILIGLLLICGCSQLRKADAKLEQENYTEAIGLYQAYLAGQPDSVEARTRLGYAYFKTGKTDEAITEFKKVLESVPNEPDAVLYMGLAYLHKGELDKGIAVLENYQNKEYPKVEEEVLYQIYMLKNSENQQPAQGVEIANQIEKKVDKIMASIKSEKRKKSWKKSCDCGSF